MQNKKSLRVQDLLPLLIIPFLFDSCKGLNGEVSLMGNLLGFGIPILFIYLIASGVKKHNSKKEKLKRLYDEALQSKDKIKILEAGRNYYNHINKPSKRNDYTTDNEMKIRNDMAANNID